MIRNTNYLPPSQISKIPRQKIPSFSGGGGNIRNLSSGKSNPSIPPPELLLTNISVESSTVITSVDFLPMKHNIAPKDSFDILK